MTCYATMERERTRRQRYLRPGNGGYHYFSFAPGHENLFERRRFLELLIANGRSTALLFHPGLSRAGSVGLTKEKNGSRTEGCEAVTRLDPIVTWHCKRNRRKCESRTAVVLVLVRVDFAAAQPEHAQKNLKRIIHKRTQAANAEHTIFFPLHRHKPSLKFFNPPLVSPHYRAFARLRTFVLAIARSSIEIRADKRALSYCTRHPTACASVKRTHQRLHKVCFELAACMRDRLRHVLGPEPGGCQPPAS